MRSYSTSYRWGGYTRNDARGLMNHDLRQHGVVQSNPQIDAARTRFNKALIADGHGGLRELVDGENGVALVMAELDCVLKNAKKNTRQHKVMKLNSVTGKREWTGEVVEKEISLRKDATVMTEIVLQLDGAFTNTGFFIDEDGNEYSRTCADMTVSEMAEAERLLDVMIDEVKKQHPNVHLLYITKHFDETHPHVQMAFVPLTEDGRVNAKEVMGAGKAGSFADARGKYSAKHDAMRQALREHGYEATFERVDAEKQHVGLIEHKRIQEQQRRREAKHQQAMQLVNDEYSKVAAARQELADEMAALPRLRRQAREEGRREGLAGAEQQRQQILDQARQEAAQQREAVLAAAARAKQRMEQELTDFERELRDTPAIFDKFLDKPLTDGKTLRAIYEPFAKHHAAKSVTSARESRDAFMRRMAKQEAEWNAQAGDDELER